MPERPPFEDVFREHRDRVYRYLLLQLRRPAEAEDITADVFLAAYLAYERSAPPPERVHMWLLRIARNRANNWRRHVAVVARTLPRLGAGQEQRSVEDDALASEDMRLLLSALGGIRARDRQLLSLRIGAGFSHAEVAVMLGISEAAAVMGTKRALERVRARMEGGGMDSELIESQLTAMVEQLHAPASASRWRGAGTPVRPPLRSPRALNLAILVVLAMLALTLIPLLLPASHSQPLPAPTPGITAAP